MDKALFTAINSIKADKMRQLNSVHEVSNVSTTGFKKAFQLTMETNRVDLPGSFTTRASATPDTLGRVDLPPVKISTDSPLDIYIEGKGVLGVFNAEGQVAFTRRGDLQVDEGRLVNGVGKSYRVQMPVAKSLCSQSSSCTAFLKEGVIYATNPEEEVAEEVEVARLMLRDASETDLEKMEDGLFKVMGQPPGDFAGTGDAVLVSNRTLEGSSVKTFDILAQMIELERSYEMKINIVKQLSDLGESSSTLMQLA